jgi:hypothetical protein
MIQGIRHDQADPDRHAIPILEVLQQPEIKIADGRSVENVQPCVPEPAHRRGIAANRIGCRTARDGKSGLIEEVTDGLVGEIPVANAVGKASKGAGAGGIEA